MLAKLSEQALTILVLTFTTKIVNACSLDISSNQVDPFIASNFYNKFYLLSALFFLFAIVITYFLQGRKNLWIVLTGFFCFLTGFFMSLAILISNSCGDLYITKYLGGSLFFIVVLFLFQIVSWFILKRKVKSKIP